MSFTLGRPKSTAHAVRAAAFLLLGFVLLLAALVPLRKGSAQTAPPTPASTLDVIVLVDNSKAVGDTLTAMQSAIADYMSYLPPDAQVGIVRYGGFPSTAFRLSNNRAAATTAVQTIQRDGEPALYDGLDLAIAQFPLGTGAKRQVLLVGTGANIGSTLTFNDVYTKLLQLGITVDVVAVPSASADSTTLDLVTSKSGGQKVSLVSRPEILELAKVRSTKAPSAAPTVPGATAPGAPGSPTAPVAPPSARSKMVLLAAMVLFFIGAGAVFFMMRGPSGKVDLLGPVTEVDPKAKQSAIGGVADKLSHAADKVLEKQGKNRSLGASLERAGIALRPGEFLVSAIMVLLGVFALLLWKKGIVFAGIGTLVAAIFGPSKYLKRKTQKRSDAFGDQLSDTLQLLSSSLRAGQGLMQAVDSVAREGDAPASEEFKRVVTETRLGRDLVDSLRGMADRVRSEDFNWVIPAIEINREVGGDLAEVLDTVAGTIRDRADIRRQVKTLSAEGRLSAYVLLSLPLGIAAFINFSTPDYLSELKHGTGLYLAVAAITMMTIGGVWLFKLCKIEF